MSGAVGRGAQAPLRGTEDGLRISPRLVQGILVDFIASETRRVGFSRAVVGLSGGVDSSLVAVLAGEALGRRNVEGLIMPYRTSQPASAHHAQVVAKKFGLRTRVVDITPMVDAYFAQVGTANRVRRGNKMARERMTILYDRSAAWQALVLGTSNKTELLLGYATQYGDLASAINPIGDLYKTQVRQLARAVGVPRAIVEKPPSGDLWVGQTDEGELGFTYEAVDRLLYALVDERVPTTALRARGFPPGLIRRVVERVRTSQFKRRPPLIAKLSARTVDREFRYPRDWGR